MRRLGGVIVVMGLLISLAATPARAAPALVAIDNVAPTLEQVDDETWSGTLSLTNLTDDALALSAVPAQAQTNCKLKLSKAAIGAAQSSTLKLTVPRSCKINEDKLALTLTASGAASQRLQVVAEVPKADGDPDWDQLAWFFYALPIVALLLFGRYTRGEGSYGITQPLEYLESTYSFKDSWLSNVTVVAGLLTGVFGSTEVVNAVLGEDAESSVALATVGSAVALILISSGPIILNASKKQWTKDEELVEAFTVGGLLLATTVTVAGAFGQLVIGWKSGAALDLDGWEDRIEIGFWIALALLLWYMLATVKTTLKAGTTPPPPPKPSELAQLISLLTAVLTRNEGVPNVAIPSVLQDLVESYPPAGTSSGDAPYAPSQRRSAMP